MSIKNKLSLNLRPKSYENLSLIDATNVVLSNDGQVLTNECDIVEHYDINDEIYKYFTGINYNIAGVIPCNDELVIFVKVLEPTTEYWNPNYNNQVQTVEEYYPCTIFRYNEKTNKLSKALNIFYNIDLGKPFFIIRTHNTDYGIKGTFTYNVENHLIISFSLPNENAPLMTIDLGTLNEEGTNNEDGDYNIIHELLSTNPEVKLPAFTYRLVKGNAYKGWYNVFIRYKINNNNYTQWFSIGQYIYVDELNNNNIIKYPYYQKTNFTSNKVMEVVTTDNTYVAGCCDYISSKDDICNNTFELNLVELDTRYKQYQLGFICVSKSYSKAFRSNDINIDNIKYKLSNNLVSYTIDELTINNISLFDVKNIINYKNRLYVSNYKESINNEKDIDINEDNINISIITENFDTIKTTINTLATDEKFTNNQYKTLLGLREIPLSTYFGINNNTPIRISSEIGTIENKNAKTLRFVMKSDNIDAFTREVSLFTFDDGAGSEIILNGIKTIGDKSYEFTISQYSVLISRLSYDIQYQVIEDAKIQVKGELSINSSNPNNSIFKITEYTANSATLKVKRTDNLEGPTYTVTIKSINPITCSFDLTESNYDDILVSEAKIITLDKTLPNLAYISYNNKQLQNCSIVINNDINNIVQFNPNKDFVFVKDDLILDTKTSFEDSSTKSSLIPGEVYSFYIHFIDKYGNVTNGFKLQNNNKITVANDNIEYYVVPFIYNDRKYYAAFDITKSINSSINSIKVFSTLSNNVLSNNINDTDIINEFKNQYSYIINNTNINYLPWYAVADTAQQNTFGVFINDNGDRLFKVPEFKISNDTSIFYLNLQYKLIYPRIEGITIPDGYVGYFISIEKPEYIKQTTGFLSRNDFRIQDIVKASTGNVIYNIANQEKSNNMYFYTSDYDLSDSISLDYNIIKIEGKDCFNGRDNAKDNNLEIANYDAYQNHKYFKYCYDCLKFQNTDSNDVKDIKIYPINKYELCVAGSYETNRNGYGTALRIEDEYNLFSSYEVSESINNNTNCYKASLLNARTSIYTNKNKTLIRLSDIIYSGDNITVNKNLDGHITYNSFLVYNYRGLLLDTDNEAKDQLDNAFYYKQSNNENAAITHYYEKDANVPFVNYVQIGCYKPYFYESKCFKNTPKGIAKVIKDTTKTTFGVIVEPINTIDLFELKQFDVYSAINKTYSNYKEEDINAIEFNKTIRRSNVIQDESKENAWRIFPVEGYKSITENKGIITNIIGIGNVLLVHTEHSLFMFDINDTLKTLDKDVLLYQPDTFEVSYKEVYTSELGFGGLQDGEAFIIDQFGYIFYNNDFNRIYRFDNNQLSYIDNDIIEYLYKYKPHTVRFANDKFNNRLLIKFTYKLSNGNNKTEVITYNYKFNVFISRYTLDYEYAYTTKSNIYFITVPNTLNNLKWFFKPTYKSYGSYHYTSSLSPIIKVFNQTVSFIVNSDYDIIKYLEYIIYKLYKVNKDIDNNTLIPKIEPFSGNTIRVYNDYVDTGKIDVTVNTEEDKNNIESFNKPYWNLGNWNFNYLRDKITNEISADDSSRLFGNFFIIEIDFTTTVNKAEFESLNCVLTKDKKI